MRIQITTENLDEIIYRLKALSKYSYELYSSVHATYSEIYQEQSLMIFPQTYLAVEALGKAAGDLRKINEELEGLNRIISAVPESLVLREKTLEEEINAISAHLDVVAANAAGILLPNYCLGAEYNSEELSARSLDELLGISSLSMDVANLSAIAVEIKKEFGEDA